MQQCRGQRALCGGASCTEESPIRQSKHRHPNCVNANLLAASPILQPNPVLRLCSTVIVRPLAHSPSNTSLTISSRSLDSRSVKAWGHRLVLTHTALNHLGRGA